ncbi:MAG TPA: methylenetetrahydrofolate reductase [NAD(P)H] [Planctomycetes bacterium]|nr:methylenetetrahydrofolate reductase [NAD(P)H] [Planctomycetota bacterium]HIL37851.1 methylenetetrahydrofolate reductase [NAD(P)H] [Planctomycetota bacterium]
MTRIINRFGTGSPVFSFEFFPPKSDEGAEALMATVLDLQAAVNPDYVSVTYGAGGTTRERTQQVVARIQNQIGLPAMAHLTCVAATKAEIDQVVDQLVADGIENILALRGDPPKDQENFQAPEGGFAHASELIAHLAKRGGLCIGAAAYPESHPESSDADEDLHWTIHKVEQGASFLVTQMIFDNEHYFRFSDRLRGRGVQVPMVPGIMPITDVAQIDRFTKMCGVEIPGALSKRMHDHQDDPASVMAIGIEHAIEQCRELLARGAPGLHFYTLNRSLATRGILAALKG